jgi:hypothetical protein
MEFFYSLELAIPALQIALLLLLSTTALLFGKIKLSLLISYLFTLYWGYFLNRENFLNSFTHGEYIIFVYFGFGLTIIVFALIGFFAQRE